MSQNQIYNHLRAIESQPWTDVLTQLQAPSLSTQSSLRLSPSEGGPAMPLLVQLNPHEELSFEQSPGDNELVARISVKNIAGRPIAYKVRNRAVSIPIPKESQF